MPNQLKAAIFDSDGVIVDTVPLHFKAWKKMFSEYGKEFNFADYKNKVDGIARLDGARAILTGVSGEELDKAAKKKQVYFLEFSEQEGVSAYPSTLNLIKQLRQHHIKGAAISSSKNCLYILKKAGIDNWFEVVITGNDIKRGKPHPDIFLLACAKLGLRPKECIVFEDATLGVEAAKRGGFKCVGVDRYHDSGRLAKADLVVNDLAEIDLEKLKKS